MRFELMSSGWQPGIITRLYDASSETLLWERVTEFESVTLGRKHSILPHKLYPLCCIIIIYTGIVKRKNRLERLKFHHKRSISNLRNFTGRYINVSINLTIMKLYHRFQFDDKSLKKKSRKVTVKCATITLRLHRLKCWWSLPGFEPRSTAFTMRSISSLRNQTGRSDGIRTRMPKRRVLSALCIPVPPHSHKDC